MRVLLGPHVEELEQHMLVSKTLCDIMCSTTVSSTVLTAYLGWREGQDLDRCALRGHGAVAIRRQRDAPAAVAVQYGGRRESSGRDRDEFPLVALAQLLQGATLQAKLVALWAWAVLRQVKCR